MMLRALLTVFLFGASSGSSVHAAVPVERVVSLDFCADQFVLKLLPREHILALSPDAEQGFSYMRASAAGLPTVRPVAEDVLTLEPSVIVRSYGGGPRAANFFEQAGIEVVQIPYAGDIEGVRKTIRFMANSLGVTERGEEIISDMDARLNQLKKPHAPVSALYMTPTGVTSGSGTLVHEMLVTAGLNNYQELPGWRSLPLERLVYERPDIVAAAFFDADSTRTAMWSPMRHPVAKQQISEQPTVSIQGAWTACAGWFLLDAIESLANVAELSAAQ